MLGTGTTKRQMKLIVQPKFIEQLCRNLTASSSRMQLSLVVWFLRDVKGILRPQPYNVASVSVTTSAISNSVRRKSSVSSGKFLCRCEKLTTPYTYMHLFNLSTMSFMRKIWSHPLLSFTFVPHWFWSMLKPASDKSRKTRLFRKWNSSAFTGEAVIISSLSYRQLKWNRNEVADKRSNIPTAAANGHRSCCRLLEISFYRWYSS